MAARTARLGLLVPSSNTVMEPDFARALPAGVTLHTAPMLLRDVTVAAEERMLDEHTLPAAETLATLDPDVVVFGCTSAGALRGPAADAALTARISDVTGAPTVSVMRAVQEALERLGAHRIAVANLGLVDNRAIGDTPPQRIAEFVASALGDAGADAIFVSCTNFRTVEALDAVAAATGLPVTSSNVATRDAVLALLGDARNAPARG